VEFDERIKYEDWESKIPLEDALMKKEFFDEYFCDGRFSYF
jgi:hypothetical protein